MKKIFIVFVLIFFMLLFINIVSASTSQTNEEKINLPLFYPSIGDDYIAQGKYEESIQYFEKSVQEKQMNISDIISISGILILGIIAIFKVKIDNYFVKPELTSKVDLEPPCCHKTTAVYKGPSINNCLTNITFNQYYFRLRAINKGNISAKNVEVIISEIHKKINESFEKVLTFPLSNLLWSGTGKMYLEYLSPKTYKYCNLGYISEPEQNNTGNIKMYFDIFFKSNIGYYIFEKGEYKITLLLACANSSKAVKQEYLIKFNGEWYDEESEMFKYGVNIKKIK